MRNNNKKKFDIGDILVADIRDLKTKKAEINAYNYIFDEINVLEYDEGETFLIFTYLGDNKLMEAYSKKNVQIEDDRFYPDTEIRKFFADIDYVIKHPLYIKSESLLKNNPENKEMIKKIYNDKIYKDLIEQDIVDKIEEIKHKNIIKKQELIDDSYELAHVENEILNLKKDAKKYNMALNNQIKK